MFPRPIATCLRICSPRRTPPSLPICWPRPILPRRSTAGIPPRAGPPERLSGMTLSSLRPPITQVRFTSAWACTASSPTAALRISGDGRGRFPRNGASAKRKAAQRAALTTSAMRLLVTQLPGEWPINLNIRVPNILHRLIAGHGPEIVRSGLHVGNGEVLAGRNRLAAQLILAPPAVTRRIQIELADFEAGVVLHGK